MDDARLIAAELEERQAAAAKSGYGVAEAIWQHLLGRTDGALEALHAFLARTPVTDETALALVEAAVLAGDRARAAAGAARALAAATARHVAGVREFVRARLALTAGDEAAARRYLAAAETAAAGKDKLGGYYPAAALDALRGLLDEDPGRLEAGLSALLDWHSRRARIPGEVFNSADAFVCRPALLLLCEAGRRGGALPALAPYRGVTLPMRIIHVRELDGEVVPHFRAIAFTTDLTAATWLARLGVALPEAAAAGAATATGGGSLATTGARAAAQAAPGRKKAARAPRPKRSATVDVEAARRCLGAREADERHLPWLRACWALALGRSDRAREHLARAEREAAAAWRARPMPDGRPNPNLVREHFKLALLCGTDGTLSELSLRMDEFERQLRGSGHDAAQMGLDGYLYILKEVVRAGPGPAPVLGGAPGLRERALSTFLRAACVPLVDGDARALSAGLDAMLAEHARQLDRATGLFSPVSAPAAHVAAVARRLGLAIDVVPAYRSYPAPYRLAEPPGLKGQWAHLPCDLLGEGLWGETNRLSGVRQGGPTHVSQSSPPSSS